MFEKKPKKDYFGGLGEGVRELKNTLLAPKRKSGWVNNSLAFWAKKSPGVYRREKKAKNRDFLTNPHHGSYSNLTAKARLDNYGREVSHVMIKHLGVFYHVILWLGVSMSHDFPASRQR